MAPRGKSKDEPVVVIDENQPGEADQGKATGDGGAREAEVAEAQERFDALHEGIDLGDEAGLIVRNASEWMVDLFKHRPKPWSQLSKAEQRDLIAGIEHNCHELVRQIAEAVVANGAEPVRCLFVGFTDKGDDIKAELKLKAMSLEDTERAVLFFHRARGQHVMVSLASATEFHREPAVDSSEEDQRALGFEAGGDEHPEDDSDLVAAADDGSPIPDGGRPPLPEDTTEVVNTGDQMIIARHGMCEVRVNLKTGMLEVLPPGEDSEVGWLDVREASPAELAAERERVADFAEPVE
jgi:hypothetical protein